MRRSSNGTFVRNYVLAFLQKQKGKSAWAIAMEVVLRGISLLIFPVAYVTLATCALVKPIRLGFLYHERLGHLALNTDLYLRRRHLGLIPRNEIHIFFIYAPANRQLVKMFSRQMLLIDSTVLAKILAPIGLLRTRFWIPLPFLGNEYKEFNSAPPQIAFTTAEEERGREFLRRMGIGPADWYVCIFARDHRYYRTFSPHTDIAFSDHRNADIDSYDLAIQTILDAGGWVIRMGSCVEKPLRFKHSRVIDYASSFREDFADVYLTAHARFFIGTTSGASDLAVLFDVPFVGVNWVPVGYAPFGRNAIFIPKRIVERKRDGQVPMRHQLEAFTGNQVSAAIIPEELLRERSWRFVDNTSQEIADAAREMLERLDGRFCDSDPCYLRALARYRAILPEKNIYRANRSPMGRNMLLSIDLEDEEQRFG